jgi:hypothetical protein
MTLWFILQPEPFSFYSPFRFNIFLVNILYVLNNLNTLLTDCPFYQLNGFLTCRSLRRLFNSSTTLKEYHKDSQPQNISENANRLFHNAGWFMKSCQDSPLLGVFLNTDLCTFYKKSAKTSIWRRTDHYGSGQFIIVVNKPLGMYYWWINCVQTTMGGRRSLYEYRILFKLFDI